MLLPRRVLFCECEERGLLRAIALGRAELKRLVAAAAAALLLMCSAVQADRAAREDHRVSLLLPLLFRCRSGQARGRAKLLLFPFRVCCRSKLLLFPFRCRSVDVA
jgi:hypothetical protein